MPAGYVIDQTSLLTVQKELRNLEDGSIQDMRKEFKSRGQGILSKLSAAIPSASPLSGFAGRRAESPYRWTKPTGRINTPLAKSRRRPGYTSIASFIFQTRRPNAGLDILELAGSTGVGANKKGMVQRGFNMVEGLKTAGYPVKNGLGRFLIPKGKELEPDMTRLAKDILGKYAQKVNRRLK